VAKPYCLGQRTLARNKALRAGLKVAALVGNCRQGLSVNDERARSADEAKPLCARQLSF